MKKTNSFFWNLWYAYRFTAVTLLNALLALVLLNAILNAVFIVREYFPWNPVSAKYDPSILNAIYEGLSEREIDTLLKETWSRPVIYNPFTQFKERPYRGFYVNVDSNGFRITKNQGPWPPQSNSLNIFLFGGSTTFGYGVPDDQTIASHLQAYLTSRLDRDLRVYNFGQGSYYSTQERILYEELLASGFVPDIALFIDGVNDFYHNSNEPLLTNRFREFVEHPVSSSINEIISTTSLSRVTRVFRDRFSRWLLKEEQSSEQFNEKAEANVNSRKFGDGKSIDLVIKRYLTNKKLIEAVSKSFGVKPIFVWQPSPTYHYDRRYHPFSEGGFGGHSLSQYGYQRIAELIEKNPFGDNFMWCADIQKNEKIALYVDKMHYSAGFSKQFAMVIAEFLIERFPVELRLEHH